MLGAQAARAERAARRARGEEDLKYIPQTGVDLQDAHIRTRAIELAQGSFSLGIIAQTEVLATAESYYQYITGGTK